MIFRAIFRGQKNPYGGHTWSILVFKCSPGLYEAKGFQHSFSEVKKIPVGAIFVQFWSLGALPGFRKQNTSKAAPAPPTKKTWAMLQSGVHGQPPEVLGFCSVLGVHFGLIFGLCPVFGVNFGSVAAWLLCGFKDLEGCFRDFP